MPRGLGLLCVCLACLLCRQPGAAPTARRWGARKRRHSRRGRDGHGDGDGHSGGACDAFDVRGPMLEGNLDEMLREVGRLNKAQSQTMINLNKDLEAMISEASDVNRKNQKLLSKERGEEEEGGVRRSLSSMFKKKKSRPVSILPMI